jgi:hypothetical protein
MTIKGRVCGAVILVVGMAAICAAGEVRPGFTCKTEGQNFRCKALNTATNSTLPLWILHWKGEFQAFGEEFVYRSPNEWSVIEMRLYPDDQSEAPYDSKIYLRSRSWTRICKGRAVFYPYYEGVEPPPCKTMNSKK